MTLESETEVTDLPKRGRPAAEVMANIAALQRDDIDWHSGRTWAYVYHPGDELLGVLQDAYLSAFETNGLSPRAFPSLRRMEHDVVGMANRLFHAPPGAVGSITSGGSESILLAVKAHRDRARELRPGLCEPAMVLPRSAHPAFDKAAHYLGVRSVRVDVDSRQRADVAAMAAAVTDQTVLLVGSAPSYPHGVLDPIAELADLAHDRALPLHVDACIGGFVLPFARSLGRSVADFDFALSGVTTISADLHKYGYAAKGASLVLHRSEETFRHQVFTFDGWTGPSYTAPNLTGTRPGGSIAAAWAVMQHLGEEGYLELTKHALEATDRIVAGVREIPGYAVVGQPVATLLAFGADDLDMAAVGGALRAKGWLMSLQESPACFHLTVSANHVHVVDEFLAALADATEEVRADSGRTDRLRAEYG